MRSARSAYRRRGSTVGRRRHGRSSSRGAWSMPADILITWPLRRRRRPGMAAHTFCRSICRTASLGEAAASWAPLGAWSCGGSRSILATRRRSAAPAPAAYRRRGTLAITRWPARGPSPRGPRPRKSRIGDGRRTRSSTTRRALSPGRRLASSRPRRRRRCGSGSSESACMRASPRGSSKAEPRSRRRRGARRHRHCGRASRLATSTGSSVGATPGSSRSLGMRAPPGRARCNRRCRCPKAGPRPPRAGGSP
mmetsp:Transcript_62495/g.179721  ORF Transcript_62495/g.179721 Transcript_62495/m.179721 type:complete len:252 (+) Transcript_62495:651-1406(+)